MSEAFGGVGEMMMDRFRWCVWLVVCCVSASFLHAGEQRRLEKETVHGLLRDACGFYDLLRTDEGHYLDALNLTREDQGNQASSASVGMGLVSLCIAHEMGFDSEAEKKALATLRAIGTIGKNANGFVEHWYDVKTGKRIGKDGFSTIDTSLMVAGAIFCANTFTGSEAIQKEARSLWESIRWESAKVDEIHFHLKQDEAGKGGPNKTRLFNEYLLLADYCAIAMKEAPFSAWGKLKRMEYDGHRVLAMNPHHALPLFTFQFPLYLSPSRTADSVYQKECMVAMEVDRLWWVKQEGALEGMWGSSAGAGVRGYGVDSSGRNPDLIMTAPAVAGFLPFSRQSESDLIWMMEHVPALKVSRERMNLYWRASLKHPDWKAARVQGIDFCPMLFGLAGHEHALGFEFFEKRSQVSF